MSIGTTVIVIIAAVLVIAAVFVALSRRPTLGGSNLRRRFGPEYDRTLARHDGDEAAATEELHERLRRHGDLKIRPLPAGAREQYTAQWAVIQEHFVESPAKAVAEADQLLARLVSERGYPAEEEYDEQVAALSVHQPRHVEAYRDTHSIARRAQDDQTSTEELRSSLLQARDLFEELVTAGPHTDGAPAHSRDAGKHRTGRFHLRAQHRGGA